MTALYRLLRKLRCAYCPFSQFAARYRPVGQMRAVYSILGDFITRHGSVDNRGFRYRLRP